MARTIAPSVHAIFGEFKMKILLHFSDQIHYVEFMGAVGRARQFHKVRGLREAKSGHPDLSEYHKGLSASFDGLYERLRHLETGE